MKKRVLVPPGRRRPRLTGGKPGAPFGNRNAVKHGRRTRERHALRAAIRDHIRCARALVDALRSSRSRSALAQVRKKNGMTPPIAPLSSPAER